MAQDSTKDVIQTSTVWELSTAHITQADIAIAHTSSYLSVVAYPEGLYLEILSDGEDIPELLAHLQNEGFSYFFIKIINLAIDCNVTLIRFDGSVAITTILGIADLSWISWATEPTPAGRDHRIHPFDFWSSDHSEVADSENWNLEGDAEGRIFIAGVNDLSDEQAQRLVTDRASHGSPLHLLAIYLAGRRAIEPLDPLPPAAWITPPQLAHFPALEESSDPPAATSPAPEDQPSDEELARPARATARLSDTSVTSTDPPYPTIPDAMRERDPRGSRYITMILDSSFLPLATKMWIHNRYVVHDWALNAVLTDRDRPYLGHSPACDARIDESCNCYLRTLREYLDPLGLPNAG